MVAPTYTYIQKKVTKLQFHKHFTQLPGLNPIRRICGVRTWAAVLCLGWMLVE